MKFVKGLSILGLAMASQGAWAAPGDTTASSDVYFSAAATCAASIAVDGGAGTLLDPIILTAAIRDDRKLAVSGHAVLNVKSKCGYTITLANMTLAETDLSGNNEFNVTPSLSSRGDAAYDGNSDIVPNESTFLPVNSTDDVPTPAIQSLGNDHTIYIREIAVSSSADRGFSARPLTGSVPVTVVEL